MLADVEVDEELEAGALGPRLEAGLRGHEHGGILPSVPHKKGSCLDNAATEQVFGHLKDEFFRGGQWPDFASFKRDLEAYIVHWNTRRCQKKLKGLTPEEFRNQSLEV